jgi:hypothetical protein
MAQFNPFTAYVVKAVFPNNTYIGCALVNALQQGLLLGFFNFREAGRRSEAIGGMLWAAGAWFKCQIDW